MITIGLSNILGKIMKKRILSIIIFLYFTTVLYADIPTWFIAMRDAILEQELSSNGILPIYSTAKSEAEAITSNVERYIMLARIENLMGQAYQRERRNDEAAAYFERGEAFAQSAHRLQQSSETWYVQAESLALLLSVRGFAFQVANGMRFMNMINRAISLDPSNFEAIYLSASSNIFANPPFRNLRKARNLLGEILENNFADMPKDVRFNVYYAMGVIYQIQRNRNEARIWFERALSLYPTNKDTQNRLGEL
jgi:tetratricopeptide (TPR) repeat protein